MRACASVCWPIWASPPWRPDVLETIVITPITRRALLATSLVATLPGGARAAYGRTTDTVRLCYGPSGLPLLAKQRGAFAEMLARDGIKVQWVGPFPAHEPSLQAVVGGSADVSFGGSSTPAFASLLAGSPLVFTQFAVADPRTTAIIAKDGSGIDRVGGAGLRVGAGQSLVDVKPAGRLRAPPVQGAHALPGRPRARLPDRRQFLPDAEALRAGQPGDRAGGERRLCR